VSVTIYAANVVETEVVAAGDLNTGDYVLLPEDMQELSIPLLVEPEYEQPILARVAGWTGPDPDELIFDDPDGIVLALNLAGMDDQVRRVLPGQDHETWSPPVPD
jgi:hypothetical protein